MFTRGRSIVGFTSVVLLAALVAAAPASATAAPVGGVVAAYTLVVPSSIAKSNLQVRAVVANGIPCPKVKKINAAGRRTESPMKMRVPGVTAGSAFSSLRACQANLPSGLSSARVGAITVPAALKSKIDRIAAFADVGCRVTTSQIQNCSNRDAWPLAKIAHRIASERPDVIFFAGDFLYREADCPAAELAKCGGSPGPAFNPEPGKSPPFSDTDYSWMADALIPMASAFAAAPILAARGNHESCGRAGNGWMLFFETQLKADACAPDVVGPDGNTPKNLAPSYSIDFPIASGRKLRVVMVDSNGGSDSKVDSWTDTQRAAYKAANHLAARQRGRESWLMTHRPMFGVDVKEGPDLAWTSITQTAAGQGFIANYNIMMASHVHVAQIVQIPGQPAQKILGSGGTIPDSFSPAAYAKPAFGPLNNNQGQPLSPKYAPYPNAKYLRTWVKYGYVVLTPKAKAGEWALSQRDVNGQQFAQCTAVKKLISCK